MVVLPRESCSSEIFPNGYICSQLPLRKKPLLTGRRYLEALQKRKDWGRNNGEASEIHPSPVEVGSLSYDFHSFWDIPGGAGFYISLENYKWTTIMEVWFKWCSFFRNLWFFRFQPLFFPGCSSVAQLHVCLPAKWIESFSIATCLPKGNRSARSGFLFLGFKGRELRPGGPTARWFIWLWV